MVEADLGYEGDEKVCDKTMYLSRSDGHKKSVVRARHETINSRFAAFNILSKNFKHDYDFHGVCFQAIAVIIQLGLIHAPLWEVEYDVDYNNFNIFL